MEKIELSLAGKSVLIVDDEFPVRQLLSKVFRKDSRPILSAGTGKEALRILRHHKPALVFLDIRLPDMDGLEVLKAALKIYSDLPVIAITGLPNEETAKQFMQAGARDFITKPIELEYLQEAAMVYLVG